MKHNRHFTGRVAVCVILLIFIFFFPSYGWRLRAWFSPSPTGQTDGANLTAENQALKAQLAKLQTIASQLPVRPSGDLRAMVYSRYPLNFKNEILVDIGSNEGVATGSAVVFQGVLIGRVEKTFSESSLVRTIFDDSFTLPVRIGRSGYDGLLVGGAAPKVGSITKHAPLSSGDVVYSAGDGTPYALPIGEITSTSTSADSLFQEATLGFSYDLNNIETVFIVQP